MIDFFNELFASKESILTLSHFLILPALIIVPFISPFIVFVYYDKRFPSIKEKFKYKHMYILFSLSRFHFRFFGYLSAMMVWNLRGRNNNRLELFFPQGFLPKEHAKITARDRIIASAFLLFLSVTAFSGTILYTISCFY